MTQQEPDDVQVPEWIYRLVRLAERARAVLIAELPAMAVVAVLVGALTWAVGSPTPWPPALCALEGFALVERHGGRFGGSARPADGAAPGGVDLTGGSARPGPDPSHRGGAGAGALLAVADIVGSGLGVVVLVVGLLAGASRPVAGAALCTTALMTVAGAGALLAELPATARRRELRTGAGLAALALIVGAVVLNRSWWMVLGLAVAADVLGLVALRVETRRERPARPERPAGLTGTARRERPARPG